jgi:hypothetical protein
VSHLVDTALATIKRERPDLASWCETKGIELSGADKLESLEWMCFKLDVQNCEIAVRAVGIAPADVEPLKRVLRVI